MRNRIIEWMKRIILDLNINDKINKKIINELKQEIMLNKKEYKVINLTGSEIKTRINKTFNHLLKNYGDFKVSTIDSFMTLILKASAFKFGISPDFQISENVNPYIDNIIDKIFQDILDKPDVKKIFDDFIENYIFLRQEKISWTPKKIIEENIKNIWEQIKQTRKNINYNLEKMTSFDINKTNIKQQLRKRITNL